MYEIYFDGASNPVWQYKTFAGLKRRLSALAEHSTLASCKVCFPTRYVTRAVTVEFHRNSKGFGWSVPEHYQGIPTKLGMGNFTTCQTNFHKGK